MHRSASPKARTLFVSRAVRWLRFLGWLDEAVEARHPHGAELDVYEAWMRGERGLSEATLRGYCKAANEFFNWLAASGTPLASVKIADIDGAIAAKKARGTCNRRTMHDYAQRLRAFFHFAETRGWCMPGLAAGIMPPRFTPDEAVPKGLKRDDVLRLLASTEGNRPADTRDRAILMLFVAYGLRAGEVGGLQPERYRLGERDTPGPLSQARPDTFLSLIARGWRGHSPLHPGSPPIRLRAHAFFHAVRADPAA